MSISDVSRVSAGFEPFLAPGVEPSVKPEEGFATFLNRSLNDVNDILNLSDKKATDLAVGKAENLHDSQSNSGIVLPCHGIAVFYDYGKR